jgi:effector-binding domain-containing protein
MSVMKHWGAIGVLVLAAATGAILAQSTPQETPIEVRQIPECVVLYTIHRGPFDNVGATIGETIAAAAQKGVYPRGTISFMYLNNPATTPCEHWLTEIRIPVADDALKLAGTLGKFTDVKKLSSVEAVVAVKPEGLATAESIYERLYMWMHENGYMSAEGPSEVFLSNARAGDYSKMKSEIRIPLRRVAKPQQTQ